MVLETPQILMCYQFVFQKHKHGHNSSKYCLSLPTCLQNSALLTEALSAVRSSLLYCWWLKKGKSCCFGGAIRIHSSSYRNTAQSASLRCLIFSIFPQKLRIILEDNEVICFQKREYLWWSSWDLWCSTSQCPGAGTGGIRDGNPVFSLLLLLFSCYENIKEVASASTRFIGKLTCMCWNSQARCSLRKVRIMNSNLGQRACLHWVGTSRHKWTLPLLPLFQFSPWVSVCVCTVNGLLFVCFSEKCD